MPRRKTKRTSLLESVSIRITQWMGTPQSLVAHSIFFCFSLLLIVFGANADTVMLVLTTAVSLEAIYLSLFIQMTVNRNTESLQDVEKDIDEIQEDVEAIEDLQEDVEDISQDIDKMQEIDLVESIEDDKEIEATQSTLNTMQKQLASISAYLEELNKELDELKDRKA